MLVPLAVALAVATVGPGMRGWDRASADTYTIQPGDTLWEIANRLQVGISVLLALNEEITSPNNIYVGQSIQVPDNTASSASSESEPQSIGQQPTGSSTTEPTTVYQIRPGDTLSQIALSHGTSVASILALNPGLNPNLLWVDTEITIQRGGGLSVNNRVGEPEASLNAGIQTSNPAPTAMQTMQYIVEPGDSWSAIAEAAGTSLLTLREHNPDANFPSLHPGDVLNIPVPDYRVPARDPAEVVDGLTQQYTVRAGDNASVIAQTYGITLSELSWLNGGADLSVIFVGQSLTVPWTGVAAHVAPGTVPAVEVRRRTYQVQADDTLSSVAARFGLSLDELRAQNPLKPSDLLVIGETLFLPGTIDPPIVAEDRTLWDADVVQYAAASLGVTPHTLLTNHGWVDSDQWLEAGTNWRLPLREGLLITVQRGDTLLAIANAHGVDIDLILADPANGVDDPNVIVIGQEIILPLAMPDFAWPASGELTDPFGLCRSWDCSYRHRGLDMALDIYEPIVASADGVVTFVGGDSSFGLGWYVEVDHGDGWSTTYAHLVEFNVYEGEEVSQGDVIGYNGNTGYSTGPHLHFEVHHNDWYVDPMVVLP